MNGREATDARDLEDSGGRNGEPGLAPVPAGMAGAAGEDPRQFALMAAHELQKPVRQVERYAQVLTSTATPRRAVVPPGTGEGLFS